MVEQPVVPVSTAPGDAFDAAVERLCRRANTELISEIVSDAARIVEQVRTGGDAALLDAVREFDGLEVTEAASLRFDPLAAEPRVSDAFRDAVERSIEAVQRFHEPQRAWLEGYTVEHEGVRLQERVFPFRRVGLYVPGGRFPYPSTVIMSVVPARVAGVGQVVVTTPGGALERSPELVHVLRRLEVDEVWSMGGAHAVAALAHGTESVEPVDFIAGPGNAWVAAAKQLVRGSVGVDKDAGPSEVVIVADGSATPRLVAADLLAQAEHDPQAVSVLVTDSPQLAEAVVAEIGRQLDDLPTAVTARQALAANGAVLVTTDLEQALEVAERLAAEHQQMMGAEATRLADRVRSPGALFVGETTPTCFGDYAAGPSHVLPTGGTARFSSGLSVLDFLRRCHVVEASAAAAPRLAGVAGELAGVEGLEAHRRSAALRGTDTGAER